MRPYRVGSFLRVVLALTLVASLACTTTVGTSSPDPGFPTPGAPVDAASGEPAEPAQSGPQDPAAAGAPPVPQSAPGGGLGRRAEAGMEGLILGTVLGGQVGGAIGAAAGAALFGLYGLITGDVPLQSSGGPSRGARVPIEDDLEQEIEDELAQQEALEDEIEAELRRQEELLAAIDKQEVIEESVKREEVERIRSEKPDDPLTAPAKPYERKLPDSIYDVERKKEGRKVRVHKTLDADRDGRPEIEIVFDHQSGAILSRSEDTNYDGVLDTHNTYKDGSVVLRTEDTNHDGMPDRWVHYDSNGQGSKVEVDRNSDGNKDGFYVYEGGSLAYEEHDTDDDGRVDRRVEYEGSRRAVIREDRNGDGTMELQTYYDENEITERTERDTNGDGRTDVWEFFEGDDPEKVQLVRKEEDLNADGQPDVKSFYENGRIVRKEVEDPSLLQ